MENSMLQNGPNFHWQGRPSAPHHTPEQDHVVTTIKNIVKNIITKGTPTNPPSLLTTTEMPEIDTESMMVVGLEETTNSTSVMDAFDQNNTSIQNVLTGTPEDTNIGVATTDMIENATNFVTESVTAAVDTAATTTRNIINTVSEAVTSAVTASTTEVYEESEHHGDGIEQQTLCIILGVILACLIMVLIILLIIYKKYKTSNSARSGAYCVTDVDESRKCHV